MANGSYTQTNQHKYRCVTDFKRSGVNEASEVLNYGTPNAEEHLDFVCNHDLISVADALSFFWQLPLHPDCHMTAEIYALSYANCSLNDTTLCHKDIETVLTMRYKS